MWMLYDIWDLEWPCKSGNYTIYIEKYLGLYFVAAIKLPLYIYTLSIRLLEEISISKYVVTDTSNKDVSQQNNI